MKVCLAHARNLKTLIRAAMGGDLGLVECRVKSTGEIVAAICAIWRNPAGEYEITPFATMVNGDPFELLEPPDPDGGFEMPDAEGC